jgi:hypothetical protein
MLALAITYPFGSGSGSCSCPGLHPGSHLGFSQHDAYRGFHQYSYRDLGLDPASPGTVALSSLHPSCLCSP